MTEIELKEIPGVIPISKNSENSELKIRVNYEWIIDEVQKRLSKEHWKSSAWNDVKACLRELDKEYYDWPENKINDRIEEK